MARPTRTRNTLVCALTVFGLWGCGGGNSATIGGVLSGLGAGQVVTLQNGLTDVLSLPSDGTFTFPTGQPANASYNVTVVSQPTVGNCTVLNGSGTVDGNDDSVTSVVVECTSVTASLGGTVSGLTSGENVTLSNAGVALLVQSNGAFAFTGTLAAGTAYDVTVSAPPPGHTCTVANPSGTIAANKQSSVTVTCV
jgi:hypothetical protein